jgi:hypothetical protein
MNLNEFFENLASNSSRNYKIAQLTVNKDNTLLKEVVRLALDPFTQFYIRKIPKYTPNTGEGISLKFALDSIGDLSKRLVTGNAAIDHLRSNLEALNEQDAKVIERIIQKDLKCGVQVSTANAVWTGLVSEYPVMLCSQFEEKLVNKLKFPAYVQLKMDGMRFNAIVKDGKCEFRSRNGKEIQLLGNLEQEFIALANGKNVVFDGELLVNDKGVVLDRQTGNGILNKANKGTISDLEAHKVHATVWDIIPYDDFTKGKSTFDYHTRFSALESLSLPKKIHLVESTVVASLEEAQTIFEKYLADGQEGIILKDMSGVWEDKRAKHQIKFKGEMECDLEILAVEEGTGKYAGKLGAVVCASRSKDGKRIVVSVGSGFNDDHRDNLWAIRDTLIGKIVAVKYNMRIQNKAGEESLFLPIFVEVRYDKEVADSIEDIK